MKTVVQTFINETSELVNVFAGGEKIVTTTDNPFYVDEKGWINASE